MAKLVWDEVGERNYETGVAEGVLFVYDPATKKYKSGVAWNGLTGMNENPSGADETELWANNGKYGSLLAAEKFGATIAAYMSPEEFDECDGSISFGHGMYAGQQTRTMFAMAWVTRVANDTEGTDHAEKLHIMYGAKAAPSGRDMKTINDSPEAMELSWEVTTTPVDFNVTVGSAGSTKVLKGKSAHFYWNTDHMSSADKANYEKLKELIQGSTAKDSCLPTPEEAFQIMDGKTPTSFANASA